MIAIFEHKGVLLHVDYTPADPVTFNTVRVMDGEYNPVGPNLVPLLNNLAIVNADAADIGTVTEAELFLSAVVGEIDASKSSAPRIPA